MEMQNAWPLPEGIKSVEVNGYPMAYHESGSGMPLILVHGTLNDYRYWDAEVGVFAEQYRVAPLRLEGQQLDPRSGHGQWLPTGRFGVEEEAQTDRRNRASGQRRGTGSRGLAGDALQHFRS